MITLNGLSGRDLSKAIIRDKQLRAEYKTLYTQLSNQLHNTIDQYTCCKLENNTNTHYIISPSTYETNSIQLTTFIRNEPYSHGTYSTIDNLLKENATLIIQSYEVTEGVVKYEYNLN